MPAPSRLVMRMRPMAIEPLWCVVPAAGLGARFGAQLPKQYVVIGDRPVLLWTLQRLAQCRCIAGLLVVLAADDTLWPDINLVAGKPVLTAIGASDRSGSVLAGLRALPDSVAADTFVLVHDAARPCVSCADIESLIANAGPAGGGLLAARIHDTLKRGDGDARVVATEPREDRWRALTPQLFRRSELTGALTRAATDGIAITDEAMAMELAGHRPLLVEGAESNIKVTRPGDLALAEYLLLRPEG